jgi:hypothetical protein
MLAPLGPLRPRRLRTLLGTEYVSDSSRSFVKSAFSMYSRVDERQSTRFFANTVSAAVWGLRMRGSFTRSQLSTAA